MLGRVIVAVLGVGVSAIVVLVKGNNKYDSEGYDNEGFDRDGYSREGYNKAGYNREGFNKDGFNIEGYNREGFDKDGFNKEGYNHEGYNKNGFDKDGFNINGIDFYGFNREGYNLQGFNRNGYNRLGYDSKGFDIFGFDIEGYNRYGFNKEGYDRNGKDKEGFYHNGYNTYEKDRGGKSSDYYSIKSGIIKKLLEKSKLRMQEHEFEYALRDIREGLEIGIKCIITHWKGDTFLSIGNLLDDNITTCKNEELLPRDLIEKVYDAKHHCNDSQHDNGITKEYRQVYFSYKVLEDLYNEVCKFC